MCYRKSHRTNDWEGAANSRVIRQAIDKLPPGQRKAIMLLKIKEMTLKEATAFSGMSIPSLKVATHRAMKNLRKLLLNKGDET